MPGSAACKLRIQITCPWKVQQREVESGSQAKRGPESPRLPGMFEPPTGDVIQGKLDSRDHKEKVLLPFRHQNMPTQKSFRWCVKVACLEQSLTEEEILSQQAE